MSQTFRRDEFAAQIRAWKFFLLSQEYTRTSLREMNRGAGSCRTGARYYNVIDVR